MKRSIVVVVAVLAAALALAQTKTSITQIKGPVVADAKLLGIVSGRVVLVNLGQGVSIVSTGTSYEIQAASRQTAEFRLSRAPDGSWGMPSGCALSRVYRNGLRQLKAVDYSVSGTSLRFTDGTSDPSESDDIVVVECN